MNKLTMQEFEGVFSYLEQPQMQVEVILASQGPHQKPIYTIRLRYPRIIHGEIMTHRLFSRNARSSRAVPVKTMLLETTTIPFVPWHWGKNQKGMQASEECSEFVRGTLPDAYKNPIMLTREQAWLEARDQAVATAEAMMDAGYHKQIPNRLLEPFSWIDTLITTTDFDNFLWLRDHEDAEPHLQDLARLVKQAVESAKIVQIDVGYWHLPYIKDEDWENCLSLVKTQHGARANNFQVFKELRKISAARCAWISYKPFGGQTNENFEREMKTYAMLISSDRLHASPMEHQATPDFKITIEGMMLDEEGNDKEHLGVRDFWNSPRKHGNLEGYIQARKLLPNEVYSSN
jgi:hypothetical protein